VRGPLDFYSPPNSYVRLPGVTVGSLSASLFLNNVLVPWPLLDGSSVPDSALSAGSVLFNEIQGAPGFYSVRFFPDRTGYWRVVVSHPACGEQALDYDVTPAGSFSPAQGGVTATFSK
jgi:hypothetical protein